jgi:hypothetical protein
LPETPSQPQIEFTTSEKYVKLYSNSVNMTVTPWDFTLSFGEIKQPGEKTVIEHLVGIVMSPQHAKVFANVLTANVREYEKNIGQINLPEAVIEGQPLPEPVKPK